MKSPLQNEETDEATLRMQKGKRKWMRLAPEEAQPPHERAREQIESDQAQVTDSQVTINFDQISVEAMMALSPEPIDNILNSQAQEEAADAYRENVPETARVSSEENERACLAQETPQPRMKNHRGEPESAKMSHFNQTPAQMEGGVYIKKAKNFVRDKILDLADKLHSDREPSNEVIKPWDRDI